jgi:hypothetical protein
MNKTELTKLAKRIALPKGWIIQKVYPKHAGKKQIDETDRILIGCPIAERMSLSGSQLSRKINSIIRQLNDLRKPMIVESTANPGFGYRVRQRRWVEFGTGFGGGKWYDIDLGINY